MFDIETAPMLAYIWSSNEQWIPIDRLTHESFIIAWAAKWLDTKGMYSDVLTSQEAIDQDDSRIVESLAEMVREADVIIAHNVNGFDLPVLNARVLQLGLEPLGPVRTLDTLKLARSNFKLLSNKLDYLGTILGIGNKIHTSFDLWRRCYYGDEEALAQMSRYNVQDVRLLEKVFHAIKPHVRELPRLMDARADITACPSCGGSALIKRGVHRTQACNYQRYQCTECHRYCRERTSDKATRGPVHPL